MSDEQEQMDYEALNARTALNLNKAQQEIERLTAKDRHLMDVYAALGIKWGEDPFICIDRIAKLEATLDKLARLGNEPNYGNSIGNVIARKAIEKLD